MNTSAQIDTEKNFIVYHTHKGRILMLLVLMVLIITAFSPFFIVLQVKIANISTYSQESETINVKTIDFFTGTYNEKIFYNSLYWKGYNAIDQQEWGKLVGFTDVFAITSFVLALTMLLYLGADIWGLSEKRFVYKGFIFSVLSLIINAIYLIVGIKFCSFFRSETTTTQSLGYSYGTTSVSHRMNSVTFSFIPLLICLIAVIAFCVVALYETKEKANKNADLFLKYAKLLDAGVISQEEFDAKKKELLG